MARSQKRPRLGRGLSSLVRTSTDLDAQGQYAGVPIDAVPPASPAATGEQAAAAGAMTVRMIPTGDIAPNPQQPRRSFDDEALAELAESMRTHGVVQPVLVREATAPEADRPYELIAGERRLRAAQAAGVEEIPSLIRPSSRQDALELALVENIHRADLNPIERAGAYRDLMDRFSLTQQDVALRLGEARATVANHLRILDLCDYAQQAVASGRLSFGHAKVLAGLAGAEADQRRLAERVVRENLSVRKLELLVEAVRDGKPAGRAGKEGQSPERPAYLGDVERQLSEAVGARVSIRPGRRKHAGRIVIEYHSLEDFDRVVEALGTRIDS